MDVRPAWERELDALVQPALVTDVDWMRHGVNWFGWMTPGEVKHFPLDERAEAIAWAAG